MLEDDATTFRRRLIGLGLSDSIIDAAWPNWWTEDADESSSARAELRYSLARKLGLEPHSLLEDQETPRFVWKEPALFKHLSGETELERLLLTSFGTALGKMLSLGTTTLPIKEPVTALQIRESILKNQPFVRLVDLLSVCWSIGIPTVHLRIFPLTRKRMAAMCVRVGNNHAIMLGKDAAYPPQVAFYLAHELAHIFLNHLSENDVLVDLEDGDVPELNDERDTQEVAADEFAMQLLTGHSNLELIPVGPGTGPRSLANAAIEASRDNQIEPGTLAMCFGYSTGAWSVAMGALRHIYGQPKDVWREVNGIARRELSLSAIPNDMAQYLQRVLGEVD